jgi:hypothetical protein
VETEFLVETLGFCLISLVKIENLPFLVRLVIVTLDTNYLSFLVLAVFNVKNFVVSPVNELTLVIFE